MEARYHKRCYQAYTKCVTRHNKNIINKGPTLYDNAFDEFCIQFIEKRIIKNNEILLLGYLLKKFISCVHAIEKVDVPYQAARLRERVQKRYPQIVFHSSKTMNKGTLVYTDTLSAGDVADDFMETHTESDTEDEVSDESTDEMNDDNEDSEEERTNKKRMATWKSDFSLQQLFHAAMEVRQLIKESKGVDSRWPPDSHDLTLALATKSIPVKLYNFLAWCLGFSSEPIEQEMVGICPSEKTKVVSIAQDLIYAESNGKKQTHKSLALGMTVRQMTGSVRLLRILHGLGHTASTDTVYRHDSALALASSNGQEIIIPRNMNPEAFTTIVWDNNDFSEETVSGKGTTHVANGIIIQNEDIRLREKTTVSKKHRTVKAPEINIVPYTSKVRGTISLKDQSSDIPLEEDSYRHEQNMARNADFVYMLARKCASESEDYLPGWTGFNTLAHKEIRRTSNIGYLPVIDAPVTDMATVNEILRHSVSICQRLLLPEIVLVFDEAIYSEAQMIIWKDEELKKRLVIRLGDFHTVMSFCTAIAKIFKDAGLQVSIQFPVLFIFSKIISFFRPFMFFYYLFVRPSFCLTEIVSFFCRTL